MKPYAVGVDLGDTNVVFGLTDLKGKLLRKEKHATQAQQGAQAVIRRVGQGVLSLLKAAGQKPADVRTLGIGSPGPLDSVRGIIYSMPNLPGFHDTPMKALVQKATGIRAFLENDAKCAALGEKWAGAGRKSRNMLMLTLGTGVGGAIILDHKIYGGADNTAGEFGHMVIDPSGPACGCGRRGCLETYASATAVARFVRDALKRGKKSLALKLAGGRPEAISRAIWWGGSPSSRSAPWRPGWWPPVWPAGRATWEAGRVSTPSVTAWTPSS